MGRKTQNKSLLQQKCHPQLIEKQLASSGYLATI
jgi:hypothetical protein